MGSTPINLTPSIAMNGPVDAAITASMLASMINTARICLDVAPLVFKRAISFFCVSIRSDASITT